MFPDIKRFRLGRSEEKFKNWHIKETSRITQIPSLHFEKHWFTRERKAKKKKRKKERKEKEKTAAALAKILAKDITQDTGSCFCHFSHHVAYDNSFKPCNNSVNCCFIPILGMWKLKHREVNNFSQGTQMSGNLIPDLILLLLISSTLWHVLKVTGNNLRRVNSACCRSHVLRRM